MSGIRFAPSRRGSLRAAAGAILLAGTALLHATAASGRDVAPARSAPTEGPASEAGAAAADSLVARARAAGREGRPHEAIRDFMRAARLDPYRHGEIQGELAYQLTWAGDLDRALHEFRRALSRDPENYDLRLGELLVVNWMGDHLAAARGYRALATAHPDRPEPPVGFGAARNWSGRRDLALEAAGDALALDPGNRDALALRDGVRRGLRPLGGIFYDWAEDSDHYQVNGLWAEAAVSPHPQVELVPFANRLGIRHPASADIDETWVGLTASWQPATRLAFRARTSVLADPGDDDAGRPFAGGISADATATDRVRGGVFTERFAAVSTRTLPEKITGVTAGAYVEVRPDWLSRVRIQGDHARYDAVRAPAGSWPDNRRWNLSATASRQVWAPARLRLGALGRYLDFDRDLDNGIWTPHRFRAGAATVAWDWGARDVWSVNGGGEFGAAKEAGGETVAYFAYRVGLFRAVGSFLLDLSAGHSEGNVETGTGYDRSYLHAGIRRRF